MGTLCRGSPTITVYAASEAALLSFARTWTSALQDRKIRVNVLSPGEIVMAALFLTGFELCHWNRTRRGRRHGARLNVDVRGRKPETPTEALWRRQEALDGKPGW